MYQNHNISTKPSSIHILKRLDRFPHTIILQIAEHQRINLTISTHNISIIWPDWLL